MKVLAGQILLPDLQAGANLLLAAVVTTLIGIMAPVPAEATAVMLHLGVIPAPVRLRQEAADQVIIGIQAPAAAEILQALILLLLQEVPQALVLTAPVAVMNGLTGEHVLAGQAAALILLLIPEVLQAGARVVLRLPEVVREAGMIMVVVAAAPAVVPLQFIGQQRFFRQLRRFLPFRLSLDG